MMRAGIVICLLLGLGAIGCGEARLRLDAAGSSFIDPLMQEWASIYQKTKGVTLNYQGKGSGAGIKMLTAKEVDFGCSDAPLNEEQLQTARQSNGEMIHVPLAMGAVVLAYNLDGVPELTLDGPTLIGIFTGKITKWNDASIVKLNPKIQLPEEKITVAYRSDASGTSFIFTDYLSSIDKEAWTPGKGTAPKFETGSGHKGNAGVAGAVKATKGSIGYVELIYAIKNEIPYARVINARGKAIKPDLKSVEAAAATVQVPEDLRYSIVNAPGEEAYPIAGTVWALVYVKQPAAKAKLVKDFLWWATHEGQEMLEALHYARLPESLVRKIEPKLEQIKG
ncbi:MAG: phosphate ABC transporter substrate-binding protein PstS [Gemmataceae bacterium]